MLRISIVLEAERCQCVGIRRPGYGHLLPGHGTLHDAAIASPWPTALDCRGEVSEATLIEQFLNRGSALSSTTGFSKS